MERRRCPSRIGDFKLSTIDLPDAIRLLCRDLDLLARALKHRKTITRRAEHSSIIAAPVRPGIGNTIIFIFLRLKNGIDFL